MQASTFACFKLHCLMVYNPGKLGVGFWSPQCLPLVLTVFWSMGVQGRQLWHLFWLGCSEGLSLWCLMIVSAIPYQCGTNEHAYYRPNSDWWFPIHEAADKNTKSSQVPYWRQVQLSWFCWNQLAFRLFSCKLIHRAASATFLRQTKDHLGEGSKGGQSTWKQPGKGNFCLFLLLNESFHERQ